MTHISWPILALAALGGSMLLWSMWEYLISPWIPKKGTPPAKVVVLTQGIYTFTGTETSRLKGNLVAGSIRTEDDQRAPTEIHFWLPKEVTSGDVELHYHSSSLHKGFALVAKDGRKMYLPNTSQVVALSL